MEKRDAPRNRDVERRVEHFDVIIVGAGLSGIGAAHHLQLESPGKTYAILEGRENIGGTWDLFRYPGIRSDSDMFTLGYSFRPWTEAKAIADGPSILKYVKAAAKDGDIERHIRFRHKVQGASWDSETATWTVRATNDGAPVTLSCNFLFMCTGYYNYDAGYTPEFAGREDFGGTVVHPQFWPETLDYAGKKVVVIGSGATAVTLVPEMAKDAARVTMLQRSPTYVVSRPGEDRMANWLRAKLPAKLAYGIVRWRNVAFQLFFFNLARKRPQKMKDRLLGMVREHLGPDYDVDKHFTPRYNPWDQRLCLVPDADLFEAIKAGRADVVTDHIDRFVPEGIRLESGETLPADIIVTATGLDMKLLHGVTLTVDGERVEPGQRLQYKGMMYSGVPNLASFFGYTNASWTLKADLTAHYVCRLLNHMDKTGTRIATPVLDDPSVEEVPFLDFTSGYVQRALGHLPRQGSKAPWKVHQNYAKDLIALKYGKVADGTMRFTKPAPVARKSEPMLEAAE
ncbi:NAD(P)/FAD-dependent oxidoreductase [Sphingomonas gilva]|uniref:NAD(P)/FAD-dependent oxidoreductase n=1 Tax=Sphingomonas gilva TaxID=2305907 RepID=A0A396RNA3_9SPHN|nr:NAD(P)/FAD-dependent oxidoreductase [Sphingomonas gilva]RHW17930.1 NAD(P)/FAD-dependent oxidoreductase [Sphingomonas gilva]